MPYVKPCAQHVVGMQRVLVSFFELLCLHSASLSKCEYHNEPTCMTKSPVCLTHSLTCPSENLSENMFLYFRPS